MNAAAISLKNATLAYGRGTRKVMALNGASFAAPAKETLCLLGPSGCGKTSALRLAAGFARPTSGEVWLRGKMVAGNQTFAPPEQRGIGYVFQDLALFPHLSVRRNVAFGLRTLDPDARKRRVGEILEKVRLSHKIDAWPHELSGGEAQRCAIARALAPRPSALLMDEPFSSLDKPLRAQLRAETRAILQSLDAACVFVTHDAEEAAQIGDTIALMRDGKVIQQGSTQELYARPIDAAAAALLGDVNLIPVRIHNGRAQAGDLTFLAPHRANGVAIAMIRPEAFIPDTSVNTDTSVAATIGSRIFLGADTLAQIHIQGVNTPLRARLRNPAPNSNACRFTLNPDLITTFPTPTT